LIKKAGEALLVENSGRRGEFHGEFGVGCSEEDLIGRRGAREEEFGSAERGERLGEREALVKEEANGDECCARVELGYVEEVGTGRVENYGWNVVVGDRESGCEGGSDAGAVGDDLLWRDGARCGEVLPGGVGVAGHALLAGARLGALAVAAVIEGEDVDAEIVEAGESGDGICQGAVAVGKEEDGEVGVAGAGVGGYPPAGELRDGGFVGGETEELIGDACDGCGTSGGSRRAQDELPLALVEEPAEGEIAAEERREDGKGDGFEQPDRTDNLRRIRRGRTASVCFRTANGRGTGHRVAVSTLAFVPVPGNQARNG
jgi:hypothetical protein